MSKQRRTADDFVRDMKAKQQHIADDIERKTSEESESSNKTFARPQRPATRLHLFRR